MSLIYCACGCGEQIEEFDSRGRKRRYIKKHIRIGRYHTKETKLEMSIKRKGLRTKEQHPMWKGGLKLSWARRSAKRKRNFNFIPLNECREDGWVGHHLDEEYVIFIPEELHKSIYHSVIRNRNMNIINDKVYDWFVNEYLKGDIM